MIGINLCNRYEQFQLSLKIVSEIVFDFVARLTSFQCEMSYLFISLSLVAACFMVTNE